MYRGLNLLNDFWKNMARISTQHKQAVYAWTYSNPNPLQTLVDEEGCGAFFVNFVDGVTIND
jgi:hypothetical protein